VLVNLTIENIAVIKKAQLDLPHGFIAMTGETGAGKSIVIDALNAVLGERTSRDLIRTGADSARVTALFDNISESTRMLLQELDLPEEEDGSLMLSRSITIAGKNNCRVNGTPVTVSVLRKLGAALINIHGQHDNQALLDPARHVDFVDAMAENEALREDYRSAYLKLRALQREQDALQIDENEKARRLDMLRHQIEELEQANIVPGEREALRERQAVMRNSERILENLQVAADLNSAVVLFEAVAALERAGEFLPAAQTLAETLRGLAYELEESAGELRCLLGAVSFDSAEADEIEAGWMPTTGCHANTARWKKKCSSSWRLHRPKKRPSRKATNALRNLNQKLRRKQKSQSQKPNCCPNHGVRQARNLRGASKKNWWSSTCQV